MFLSDYIFDLLFKFSVMFLSTEKVEIVAIQLSLDVLNFQEGFFSDLMKPPYCAFFQPVKLAVVCRDGQLHLFEHILNG